ncbi:MAG: hypothetical protein R3F34_09100 [Planctomycetota bacterium]
MKQRSDDAGPIIVVLVAVVVVIAAAAAWFLFDRATALRPVAAPARPVPVPSTVPSAPPAPVELEEATPSIAAPDDEQASRRVTSDEAVGTVHWSDLLAPVDVASGAPIAGARLVHVDERGERRELALDAVVGPSDLAIGAVAVLVARGFCPRAFETRELARRTEPLPIALGAAGQLRIELEDPSIEDVPALDLRVGESRRYDVPAALDPHLAELGLDTAHELAAIHSFGTVLREIVDGDPPAAWLAEELQRALRYERLLPLFALEGPPTVGCFAYAELTGRSEFPIVLDDVPVGALLDVEVEQHEAEGFHVSIGEPTWDVEREWSRYVWFERVVDAERPLVVAVRLQRAANLRGRIPAGSTEGVAHIVRRSARGGTYEVSRTPIGTDGEFGATDITPGAHVVEATWRLPSGAAARALREVDVPPGADVDLGLLTPDAGPSLHVVPRLVLDGADDDAGVLAAVHDAVWSMTIGDVPEIAGAPSGVARIVEREDFEPFELSGFEPARYRLLVAPFALPGDLAERFRVTDWKNHVEVDLVHGDATVELVLEVRTAVACEVVVVSPPTGKEDVIQAVAARAYETSTGLCYGIEFDDGFELDATEAWSRRTTTSLPPGHWVVAATSRSMSMGALQDPPAEEMVDFVGTAEFDVAPGESPSVTLHLERAAAVRGSLAAFGRDGTSTAPVMAAPSDMPRDMAALWSSWITKTRTFELRGLLPNRNYAVFDSEAEFESGAAGTVTELVE